MAALEYLGQPLPVDVAAALEEALADTDEDAASEMIQKTLDPHCLTLVNINPVRLFFMCPCLTSVAVVATAHAHIAGAGV